jgi:hypothetical protein
MTEIVHSNDSINPDTGWTRSVEEYVQAIRPELERDIDEQIAAQTDPEWRAIMKRHRARLIHESMQACRIANYRHRMEHFEARLRPALVTTP